MSVFNLPLTLVFSVWLLFVVNPVNGNGEVDVHLRMDTESKLGTYQCTQAFEAENQINQSKENQKTVAFSAINSSRVIVTFHKDATECKSFEKNGLEDIPCVLKEPTVNSNDVDGKVPSVYYSCEQCVTDVVFGNHSLESKFLGQPCGPPKHLYMYNGQGNFNCSQCCQHYYFDEMLKKCMPCEPGQSTRGASRCRKHDPIPPLVRPGPTTTTTTGETTQVELTTKPTASTPASTSRPSTTTPQVKDAEKPRVCRPTSLVVNETTAYTASLVWECSGGAPAEKFIVIVECAKGRLIEEVKEMYLQLSDLAPDTRYEAKIASIDAEEKHWSNIAHFRTTKKPPSLVVKAFEVYSSGNLAIVSWDPILSWPSNEEPYLGYKIRCWEAEKHPDSAKIFWTPDAKINFSLPVGDYQVDILVYNEGGDGHSSEPQPLSISNEIVPEAGNGGSTAVIVIISFFAGVVLACIVLGVIYCCHKKKETRNALNIRQDLVPEPNDDLISVTSENGPAEGVD